MMAKHFTLGTVAIAALVCGTFYAAYAAKMTRYGEFVYSSLCMEKESGDAAGYRIKLLRSEKGDNLYFEWSEGPLFGPRLASKLTIDPRTSKITFTVPADAPAGIKTYKGEISQEDNVLKK